MTYYAWPILTWVSDEQKWSTVLPKIVQTGISACKSFIPKGENYHTVIERELLGFFSIIAAIRSRFPLALSSMHTYRYSKPMLPVGFGYDSLLSLSPQFWVLPVSLAEPDCLLPGAAAGSSDTAFLCCSGLRVQSHAVEEDSCLVHGPISYHSVTA